MAPRFRADQIGSLLRPEHLLEARSSLASSSQMYNTSADAALKSASEAAITRAVEKQRSLSIRPYCSGEYNRHIFYAGLFERLEGMTVKPDLPIDTAFRTDFPTTTALKKMGAETRAAVVCTAPIRWRESAYLEEWRMLRSSLPQNQWAECKITIPSPTYQHMQLKPGTAYTPESGYTSDGQYFEALGTAYTAEIQALYDEGLRNIQIDDPHLTYFCDSQFLDGCRKDGVDADELLDTYLEAHNVFLRNLPADLVMGIHLCRGNMSGSVHWVSGSYEQIARKLFTATDYSTYYLEFDDTERQGGFEPLRFLPKGKNVVLGLVSTKRAQLEPMAQINEAVGKAVEVIAQAQAIDAAEALDCLALSPQCGFSSSSLAGGKHMTMDLMWEKLMLVRDAARRIWSDAASISKRVSYQ